jgi:hypothetical protein
MPPISLTTIAGEEAFIGKCRLQTARERILAGRIALTGLLMMMRSRLMVMLGDRLLLIVLGRGLLVMLRCCRLMVGW